LLLTIIDLVWCSHFNTTTLTMMTAW